MARRGRGAFIEYFERKANEYPGKRFRFKGVMAVGNYVVCAVTREGPHDGSNWAGINILGLNDNGKKVEQWNALSKNMRGMQKTTQCPKVFVFPL